MEFIYSLAFTPPERKDPLNLMKLHSGLLTFKTKSNKKMTGFMLRPPECSDTVILYSHGNACDAFQIHLAMRTMANKLKVNIFIYDYVGYGANKLYGKPTELGCFESIDGAYTYLIGLGFNQKNIIIHGNSIGSGPSCYLASKYGIAGLILESPMLSCFRVMTESSDRCCIGTFNDFFSPLNYFDFCKLFF